jgi:hypothetical protein
MQESTLAGSSAPAAPKVRELNPAAEIGSSGQANGDGFVPRTAAAVTLGEQGTECSEFLLLPSSFAAEQMAVQQAATLQLPTHHSHVISACSPPLAAAAA